MINALPIIGWLISAVVSISLAIPFWFCWTFFGIGKQYGYFLPTQFQSIPFWDCVMLFIVISIIKTAIPYLIYVNQDNKK